jgi:hypothetical protein
MLPSQGVGQSWFMVGDLWYMLFIQIFLIIWCRPKNHREIFNLCHVKACNVIGRVFGIVKHRFQQLVVAPEYDLTTQAKMVPAICVLHNFIRIYDVDDLPIVDMPSHKDQSSTGTYNGWTWGGHIIC